MREIKVNELKAVSYTHLDVYKRQADNSAKIIVIGVGGAGNNAVNRMIDEMKRQKRELVYKGSILDIYKDTCLLYTSRCVKETDPDVPGVQGRHGRNHSRRGRCASV